MKNPSNLFPSCRLHPPGLTAKLIPQARVIHHLRIGKFRIRYLKILTWKNGMERNNGCFYTFMALLNEAGWLGECAYTWKRSWAR